MKCAEFNSSKGLPSSIWYWLFMDKTT